MAKQENTIEKRERMRHLLQKMGLLKAADAADTVAKEPTPRRSRPLPDLPRE